MEGWFGKAAYPIVFIAPNQYICLFAGAAGMSVAGFFAANISGTIVRLYLIRRLGEAFEAPIDDLLGFIRDYRTPLLVVSIALFAVVTVNELRRQSSGLEELEQLAEAEAEPDARRRARPTDRLTQLASAAADERWSTPGVVERPGVGEGQAAPERLAVEVATEAIAEVQRQGEPVAHDHDRPVLRRHDCVRDRRGHPGRDLVVRLPPLGQLAAQVAVDDGAVAGTDPRARPPRGGVRRDRASLPQRAAIAAAVSSAFGSVLVTSAPIVGATSRRSASRAAVGPTGVVEVPRASGAARRSGTGMAWRT